MAGFITIALEGISIIEDIFKIKGLYERYMLRHSAKDFHPRSEVVGNPSLVIGDRASEKDGFDEKQYLKREDIDTVLEVNFDVEDPKDRGHNIVVITGRHASGKSRVVWEFIRSDAGARFKTVYIPRISTKAEWDGRKAGKEDLRQEMARIKPSSLVVLDDIDNLLDMGYRGLTPESLLEILARVNDRDQACIITLSSTVPDYREILELLHSDSALGRRKTKRILFLEIEDIKRGDETFLWCTANLPMNRYSKVIGGYIPQLTRYADVNIQRILAEPSAVLYLTSFIILKKFRNRFRVLEDRIEQLYGTIRTKDLLDDLPESPDPERIRVLFDIGMLRRCGSGNDVEVDDDGLFESFTFYCVTHGKSNKVQDRVICRYLSESLAAETDQAIRLVEAGHGEDPAIYSRILTRTKYPELRAGATNWFIKKFFEHSYPEGGKSPFPVRLRPEYASDPERIPEIEFAAGIIVGRAEDPIGRCESFLNAGIKPNINLVCELIRASMDHKLPQERKDIKDYALGLKRDAGIGDSLYFCLVSEASDPDYDEERIRRALDLYDECCSIYTDPSTKDDEQLDNLVNTMFSYRSRLIEKADSKERILRYFSLLRNYPELRPDKSGVKKVVFKISGKAGSTADPLLLLLVEGLLAAGPDTIGEDARNTGLLCIIDNCQEIQTGLDIYDRIAPKVESSMHPAFTVEYKQKEKFLNVMAIRLARKMKRLSLESGLYSRIQAILKERTHSACLNDDFGAAGKLYNIVLNSQPLRPAGKALDNLFSLYGDESWLSGKRDIDSLNSAFQNAIEIFRVDPSKRKYSAEMPRDERCRRLRQTALLFDKLRRDGKIEADGRFKLFMFRTIEQIRNIDGRFPTDDIRERIEFDESVERLNETTLRKEELLWCQVIRLSSSPTVPVRAAEICLKLAEKEDFLMDTINHLITAYCERFPGNGYLKGILEGLEARTLDAIPHSIHDYCHYMAFDTQAGSLRDAEDAIRFIDGAWTRLQHINQPLRETGKADLLCRAISTRVFDLQQAIDIVNFAIMYDRRYRYRPTPILSQDVILELVKKFRKEEEDRNRDPERWPVNRDILLGYADQIQEIIYSLDSVSYPDKDFVFRHIKNPIDAPLAEKYGRREFTRIPMESDVPDIRRAALMKRIDESGRARCSAFEANCFLYQELFQANSVILHDCGKRNEAPEDIGDYLDHILLILESMKEDGRNLDLTAVNRDRFQKVFQRTPHWMYYENFFEGYLLGGYVPEDLADRWRDAAEDYGFAIRG